MNTTKWYEIEELFEREKQRLLKKYNCKTLKEVLAKQDKILEEQGKI